MTTSAIMMSLQDQRWWDHMWGSTGWGWGWMMFMMAFWAVVLALLVWMLVRFSRGRSHFDGWTDRPAGGDPAEEVLRERYARGEIDREMYRRMLGDLRGGSSPDRPD